MNSAMYLFMLSRLSVLPWFGYHNAIKTFAPQLYNVLYYWIDLLVMGCLWRQQLQRSIEPFRGLFAVLEHTDVDRRTLS
jgi:hypothetical protein